MKSRVGLCSACAHARVIASGRGSTFYLCTAARWDPRLTKYPRLPVLVCHGHAPSPPSQSVRPR